MIFIELPLDDLKENHLQPSARTAPSAIAELLKLVKKNGILMPLLVTSDGVVLDGHRRLWCARQIGMKKIWCVVSEKSDPTTIVDINIEQSPLRDKLLLHCWKNAASASERATVLRKMKASTRTKIVALCKIYTEAGLLRRVDQKEKEYTPALASQIYGVRAILVMNELEVPELDKIGDWLVLTGFRGHVMAFKKLCTKRMAKTLLSRIKGGHRYPAGDWKPRSDSVE